MGFKVHSQTWYTWGKARTQTSSSAGLTVTLLSKGNLIERREVAGRGSCSGSLAVLATDKGFL